MVADEVTVEAIIRWSLQNCGGVLTCEKVYQAFRGQIGFHEVVRMLQAIDGKRFEVDGKVYEVARQKVDKHSGRYLKDVTKEVVGGNGSGTGVVVGAGAGNPVLADVR